MWLIASVVVAGVIAVIVRVFGRQDQTTRLTQGRDADRVQRRSARNLSDDGWW